MENTNEPEHKGKTSDATLVWWAKKAKELACQMEQGGVQTLTLHRLSDGKYEFEITPEAWPNA